MSTNIEQEFFKAMKQLGRKLSVSIRLGNMPDMTFQHFSVAWAELHKLKDLAVAVALDPAKAEVQVSLISAKEVSDKDGFYPELQPPKHEPLRIDVSKMKQRAMAAAIEREVQALCAIEHATGL